jgi:uncharacterized NAD(P)/FAD-binding protein YdhS
MVVVIIGSGFSGSLTAVNLARKGCEQIKRVIVLDATGRFGPGLAYSTDSPVHYLNVPAGNMSALEEDPTHFLKWAQRRDAGVQTGSFLPRRMYGEYISELLDEARMSRPGLIDLRHDGAVSARPQADGRVLVTTASGATIVADRVVLATGNAKPPMVPGLDRALQNHAGYIGDPWATGAVRGIKPHEPVLIVGAGLTMMDVVMQLHAQQHEGHILAISRHGLLSAPHRSPSRPPTHRDAPAGLNTWDGSAKQLLRIVRKAVREHAAKGTDWRDVIGSLRPVTSKTWQKLDDAERARFLSRLRSYWDIVRHRAAPETAAIIADLRAARQLVVRAGRMRAIRIAPGSGDRLLEASFVPKGSSNVQTVKVARVINCMGPMTDVRSSGDPLMKQLLSDGFVTPDAFGLGLESSDMHASIEAGGTPSRWLSVVGPFRRAQVWENTAVPELKKQAAQVAEAIVQSVAGLPIR